MPGKPLYSIQSRDGSIVIRFHTSRIAWLVSALITSAFFLGMFLFAVQMGWNGTVLSGVFGGCFSLIAVTWFAAAEHITRYTIFVTEDLIGLRREFQGVPVGSRKLYAKVGVTDLGIYPIDNRGHRDRSQPMGTLCIWVNNTSVELEPVFPIHAGLALARDLQSLGLVFPRTFEQFSEDRLIFGGSRYLSF